MLYLKCPGCKRLLGNLQPIFDELETQIKAKNLPEKDHKEEITKAINSLGLERMCCKMRLSTYTPLIKIVK